MGESKNSGGYRIQHLILSLGQVPQKHLFLDPHKDKPNPIVKSTSVVGKLEVFIRRR
jgi:hypothetical protein